MLADRGLHCPHHKGPFSHVAVKFYHWMVLLSVCVCNIIVDRVIAIKFLVFYFTTENVLKLRTPKFLTKWQKQTVLTQIRLIWVCTVCHSTEIF